MAESHNDFAAHALDEGNYREARREALVAETNAQLAIEKSPKERCAVTAPPPGPGDLDGDGVLDDVDQCPRVAEDRDSFEDDDGCPDPDNDKDGIPDTSDKCPTEPEDKDGFEDGDGCPDPDNDKDGILDGADKCPDVAEDADGVEDDDGCPDPDNGQRRHPRRRRQVPDRFRRPARRLPQGSTTSWSSPETKIELKQTVYFDTNRAKIKRVSFALLDDVAQAMKDNPKIKVEIGGHTDSQGNNAANMKLSQKRAESVRIYLIKKRRHQRPHGAQWVWRDRADRRQPDRRRGGRRTDASSS